MEQRQSVANELFDRWRHDHDQKTYEQFVEEYRPVVWSVCRRYLRDPADIDDAVQETFLKLSRYAGSIRGSITAWLTATAHTICIDLIRRCQREKRRWMRLTETFDASSASMHHRLLHEMIGQRLHEALLSLDEASRELIIARFYRKEPLRVIAGRCGTSVATISRRVSSATKDLAAVLRDMGLEAVDDLTVAEHFGEAYHISDIDDGLRFAPDWRSGQFLLSDSANIRSSQASISGWHRPIRIGVWVSYLSLRATGCNGIQHLLEDPVWSTRLLDRHGLQFIAIAESGTTSCGPVECTLRDYELMGGLIDSADAASLKTLDVILVGMNWAMAATEARALVEAVQSGVGLLNEFWLGSGAPGLFYSQDALALSLGRPPSYGFHRKPFSPKCTTATVHEEHHLLPGLKAGAKLSVSACGPVYQPLSGTKVLITKDQVVEPDEHRIPGLGPVHAPVFLVGQLGAGRVVVSNVYRHAQIAAHLSVSEGEYLLNILRWLAEPRRQVA